MKVTTFAVDLAKEKFQVHGYTSRGEKVVTKRLARRRFLAFFEEQEMRCRVVMEACASAHHWGRVLQAKGYEVELLPPQHVATMVVGNKNDPNDTDAIYETSNRRTIRRVPVKTEHQQDIMAEHRVRERLKRCRTAVINQMRGLLAERGRVFPKSPAKCRQGVLEWLEEADSSVLRELIGELLQEWRDLDRRITHCEKRLTAIYRATPACRLIGEIGGIGELTATAMVGAIGDGSAFSSGRQCSAWAGLTPQEHSSGNRRHLGAITKRGNTYLRTLLVHGARAAVTAAMGKADKEKAKGNDETAVDHRTQWIVALVRRRGWNKAVVAVANKNARIAWAMLRTGECYRVPQEQAQAA